MSILSLAPLQGLTDYHFRNSFIEFFGGIDFAYGPYIRFDKNKQLKKSQIADLAPENNSKIKFIPQLLTNNADEFISIADDLYLKGYETINLNLGCPYPMVAKRKLGSGLLEHPDMLLDLLEKVLRIVKNKVSLKIRIGYANERELLELLPRINKLQISDIIIHPRTAKQLYKGGVHLSIFEECIKMCSRPPIYNGDICTLADFERLSVRMPEIDSWMLGRGVLANPFLPAQIKGEMHEGCNKKNIFSDFHALLYHKNSSVLSGSAHVLRKMLDYWDYFSLSFSNSKKVYKVIKKAKTDNDYHNAVNAVLRNEDWLA